MTTNGLKTLTFTAIYKNEATPEQALKISHAIIGGSNFTFGRSQFDLGPRRDAWTSMGFTSTQLDQLTTIGVKIRQSRNLNAMNTQERAFKDSMELIIQGNPAQVDVLDTNQQLALFNSAKGWLNNFFKTAVFESPSAIAHLMDIANQHGPNSINATQAARIMGSTKKVNSDSFLNWRISVVKGAGQIAAVTRRTKNIENTFLNIKSRSVGPSQLISSFEQDLPVDGLDSVENTTTDTTFVEDRSGLKTYDSYIEALLQNSEENTAFYNEIYRQLRAKYNTTIEEGEINLILQLIDGQLLEVNTNDNSGGFVDPTTLKKLPLPYNIPANRVSITAPFGPRWRGEGRNQWHMGIDLATSLKPGVTDVVAVAAGTVIGAGVYKPNSYVVVYHPILPSLGTPGYTLYLHMSPIYVKKGQKVQQGTILGKEGDITATGAVHLHFEVRNASAVVQDPAAHLNFTPAQQVLNNNLYKNKVAEITRISPAGLAGAKKYITSDINNYGFGKV